MEIARLRVFREVAQLGSFTAAAKSLRYTQSAVSRQIGALEQDVSAPLFDRVSRGARLTDAGRCLLGHAEAVLERLDTAERELAALRELTGGRLRIGAFATAEAVLVPTAMASFRAAHPDVELSLTDGLTAEHIGRLRRGELDVAVLGIQSDRPGSRSADTSGLRMRRLLDDPIMVALPAGHRFADRGSVRLTALADENWIAGSTTIEDTLIGVCLRSGFRPTVRYVVGEWTAKQGLVAAGLGVTLVPGLAVGSVRPDIVLKKLRADEQLSRGVYVATADGVATPPALRRFLECLADSATRLRRQLAEVTRTGR